MKPTRWNIRVPVKDGDARGPYLEFEEVNVVVDDFTGRTDWEMTGRQRGPIDPATASPASTDF